MTRHSAPSGPLPVASSQREQTRAVVLRLADEQLEQLADLLAERLAPAASLAPGAGRLVDARVVAAAIGMSAAWVREHGAELGGQRMGEGERPRWRFDLEKAVAAWTARESSVRSVPADTAPAMGSRRRRAARAGTGVDLLPIGAAREVRRAS